MAIAKKCDRCGKFHEIYNKLVNLCPDCKDSFFNWLKKR